MAEYNNADYAKLVNATGRPYNIEGTPGETV